MKESFMTRVSLIGCGRWGRNILRDLVTLGCEVTVADPDPEMRRQAEAGGAAGSVADLDELPYSDGIVIATPASTHGAVIERALPLEVPVFVEKPMTCDANQARRFADQAQGRLFVMDKWRYHPGVEELRRIAATNELGQPLGMHLRQTGWGSPHPDVDVIWVLAPHCLGIFLEVFGALPAVKYAVAETRSGQAVGLHGFLGDHPWAALEVSARSPVKRREFRLHCEQGAAWLDEGWNGHISIVRDDASQIEKRSVSTEMPLLRELRSFVAHLEGGPPPRSAANEGALIVERISELRQAARIVMRGS